ncbi:NUDIX hydrolase [Chloroflexota bacterium]
MRRGNKLTEEKTLSSKIIFEGQILKLRIDTIQTSGGKQPTREIIEHSDCVAVIAIDDDNNVLLVKQFRRPVEKELLEIPAGMVELDEAPEDTVRRELQEETGYLPRKVEKLIGFYSTPGFCTEYLHLYLATDLTPSQLFAEDTDSIELVRIPFNQIPELISSNKICDAKTIAGLLFYFKIKEIQNRVKE